MVPMSYSVCHPHLSEPALPVASGIAGSEREAKTCTTRRAMETRMERWPVRRVASMLGGVG